MFSNNKMFCHNQLIKHKKKTYEKWPKDMRTKTKIMTEV